MCACVARTRIGKSRSLIPDIRLSGVGNKQGVQELSGTGLLTELYKGMTNAELTLRCHRSNRTRGWQGGKFRRGNLTKGEDLSECIIIKFNSVLLAGRRIQKRRPGRTSRRVKPSENPGKEATFIDRRKIKETSLRRPPPGTYKDKRVVSKALSRVYKIGLPCEKTGFKPSTRGTIFGYIKGRRGPKKSCDIRKQDMKFFIKKT